jgi:hypothetical protein
MADFRVGEFVIAVNPTNPDHPSNVPAVVEHEYQLKQFPLAEAPGVERCWCYGVRLLVDGEPLVWADSTQLKRVGDGDTGESRADIQKSAAGRKELLTLKEG